MLLPISLSQNRLNVDTNAGTTAFGLSVGVGAPDDPCEIEDFCKDMSAKKGRASTDRLRESNREKHKKKGSKNGDQKIQRRRHIRNEKTTSLRRKKDESYANWLRYTYDVYGLRTRYDSSPRENRKKHTKDHKCRKRVMSKHPKRRRKICKK